MPNELTQIMGAVPQLAGQTVLRVDPAQGGAVLVHDLSAALNVLHVRFMVAIGEAVDGQVTLAGGITEAGPSAWQIDLDASARSVSLSIGEEVLTAELPPALDWHTVEAGLNRDAGTAALRINGIERASASVPIDAARYAWLGGAFATQGFSGTVDLDRWVISDEPIGVAVSSPTQDHAGDPRRWLVVYNRSVEDSCTWADAYRARRGIPHANLCGLDLPTSETITAGEYETLRQQVNAYLDDNGLRGQVIGVLLGYRVPGYADVAGQGALVPIASYLHTDNAHGLPVINPLYQSTIGDRPVAADFADVRLTGRIDAPTLAEAIALSDRADALVDEPMSHDQLAEVVVDLNPDDPSVGPLYTQPITDWAQGQGLASLRLPTLVYDAQPPTTVSGEAVVWGWRDAAPPTGFFASPAGRRAICMQFDLDAQPATTRRDSAETDWLNAALQAGYAFAAAPTGPYSLSALPMPGLFFEALQRGWTVAEAWLVSQAFLRDGLHLVGDPLMPIPFPKAGYDVFGPAPRLDQIDLGTPIAQQHAGERSLQLEPAHLPEPGQPARYLVRRRDASGRSDHAAASAFVAISAGQPIRPALPAWPTDADWPVLQRDGRLVLVAVWPGSLRSQGVDSVWLVAQAEGGEPVMLESITPVTGQRRAVFVMDRPDAPTRYRFSVSQGAASFETPWSAQVSPAPLPSQSITLLEASS